MNTNQAEMPSKTSGGGSNSIITGVAAGAAALLVAAAAAMFVVRRHPSSNKKRIVGGGVLGIPNTDIRRNNLSSKNSDSVGKVAIFFPGRINAYEHNKDKLLELKNKYNATFFCSINKTRLTPYVKTFLEIFDIKEGQWNIEPTNVPKDLYNCHKAWESSYERLYSAFYHRKRCMDLIEAYQTKNAMRFDVVVFYRADIASESVLPLQKPVANTIYVPSGEDFNGLNDHMAYGDFESMKKYCSTVDTLLHKCKEVGTLIHPETLDKKQTEIMNLAVSRFEFSTPLHPARKNSNHEYLNGDSNSFR